MEVLLFGIVNLIYVVVLTAPLWILVSASVYSFRRGKGRPVVRRLSVAVPVVAISCAAAWAYASHTLFVHTCRSITPVQIFSAPSVNQRGFRVEKFPAIVEFTRGTPDFMQLLVGGPFEFVDDFDYFGRRLCKKEVSTGSRVRFESTHQCDHLSGLKSNYAIYGIPPKRVERWWGPPVYILTFEVMEIESRSVVARATDVLLGDSHTSRYLRLMGGDQDFKLRSCGYASTDVGPFRPSLVGRPRMSQYSAADANFILDVLYPNH